MLKSLKTALHRGAFCQFPFRWIYYYGSNKSTGKKTGKMHICALCSMLWIGPKNQFPSFFKPVRPKHPASRSSKAALFSKTTLARSFPVEHWGCDRIKKKGIFIKINDDGELWRKSEAKQKNLSTKQWTQRLLDYKLG